MRPRIKICCISSEQEVARALAAGADLLGFVAPPLGGLGVIPEDRIASLIARVPPGADAVLLTGLTGIEQIAAQVRRCRPQAIQLVRPTALAVRQGLTHQFPGLRLLQVVHVLNRTAVQAAREAQVGSHGLILDSAVLGDSEQLGATGRTHDWAVSAAIVQAVDVPVFLAGGLRADNVRAARAQVAPFGLDLCTGVRSGGALDPARLAAFFEAASAALEA